MRARWPALLVALALLLAPSAGAEPTTPEGTATPAPSPRPRAEGGTALLAGAESARLVAVGTIVDAQQIDLHGWAATLRVERTVSGEPPAADTPLRIAWEELARARAPRFAAGTRIVVALDPMPGYSLWLKRFPKRDVLAVAERGRAFLRDPNAATVDGLATFLALSPEQRSDAAGVAALAALSADAAPSVAAAALGRLLDVPGLAGRLGEAGRSSLARTLGDPARPVTLRVAATGVVGKRRLTALRPEIVALTTSPPPLDAAAWTALADLDGSLETETLTTLLASPDPALRVVAAEHLRGSPLEPRLATLAREDPEPSVRGVAVRAWVAAQGMDSLEVATAALFDPAPPVRASAAQAVGSLGAPVVPQLDALARSHRGQEAAGPMAALRFAGPSGDATLVELSKSHPDERTRSLARLLLGQDPAKPH